MNALNNSEFDFGTTPDFGDSVISLGDFYSELFADDQPQQQVTVRFALQVVIDELQKALVAIDSKEFNLARTIISDLHSGAKDLLEDLDGEE